MKLTTIKTLVAATVLLTSGAYAIDGTINFTGSVVAGTCKVSSGSNGTQTVDLGNVSASSLAESGAYAGATPFAITLTDCGDDLAVAIKFDGDALDTKNQILKLSDGQTATNVGVGIYPAGSATPITLYTTRDKVTPADGTATFNYVAKYVATGKAGAGTANSSATFTLMYP